MKTASTAAAVLLTTCYSYHCIESCSVKVIFAPRETRGHVGRFGEERALLHCHGCADWQFAVLLPFSVHFIKPCPVIVYFVRL